MPGNNRFYTGKPEDMCDAEPMMGEKQSGPDFEVATPNPATASEIGDREVLP